MKKDVFMANSSKRLYVQKRDLNKMKITKIIIRTN